MLMSTCIFLFGMWLGYTSVQHGWWILLPFAWMLIVHFAQVVQFGFSHYSSHGTFNYDRFVLFFSVLLLCPATLALRDEHVELHHDEFMTDRDHTKFRLQNLGFGFGWKIEQYWLHFRRLMFGVHLPLLKTRIEKNYKAYPVSFCIIWSGVFALVIATNSWAFFVSVFGVAMILWQFPLVFFALLEHHFPMDANIDATQALDLEPCQLTTDIMFGAEYFSDVTLAVKALWWCELAKDWVVRFTFFPLNILIHTWHHWAPNGDWRNGLWARYKHRQKFPHCYNSVKTVKEGLQKTFDSMRIRQSF